MKRLLSMAVLSLLAACTYPGSHIGQGGGDSGLLSFEMFPVEAQVAIDGRAQGSAGTFSGKHPLAVDAGTHRVQVMAAGQTILDKKYVIEAGALLVVKNDTTR